MGLLHEEEVVEGGHWFVTCVLVSTLCIGMWCWYVWAGFEPEGETIQTVLNKTKPKTKMQTDETTVVDIQMMIHW